MKSVCRQVYDSYPDFDLTHKKVFIKETVKSVSGPTIHLSSSLSLSLGVLVSLSLMCMYLFVYLAKEENGDGNEGDVKCILSESLFIYLFSLSVLRFDDDYYYEGHFTGLGLLLFNLLFHSLMMMMFVQYVGFFSSNFDVKYIFLPNADLTI